MSRLKEEIFKEEITSYIEKLKYRSAIVECALFKKSQDEENWYSYVLKVILDNALPQSEITKFIDKDRFVLFKTSWSLEMLGNFLSALINVRKVQNENNQQYPKEGIMFDIGGYKARICGNYRRAEIDLVGSDIAKRYFSLRLDKPFYFADYSFYYADGSLLSTHPPILDNEEAVFSNPAQAVKYYFDLSFDSNTADFQNPWAGIILPIHGARIKKCTVSGKNVDVEIEKDGDLLGPEKLNMSVICTGKEGEILPKKIKIEKTAVIQANFTPSVVEIDLFKENLKLDHWSWAEIRQSREQNNLQSLLNPGMGKNMKENGEGLPSRKVFIVHGHDHQAKSELALLLTHLGLEPIILHEQPNEGKTIIEKLESHSNVGFCFVLLTPDDLGTKRGSTETFRLRARQNVVFEFGLFVGLLSRKRVCCLYSELLDLGGLDLPSDLSGLVYISYKSSINEVTNNIVKELKAAGYNVQLEVLG